MKRIFLVLIILFFSMPVFALVLQGNAQFNDESARAEAFNNISYALGPNEFRYYWTDPNYSLNSDAISQGLTRVANRQLAIFSDGTYGVRFDNDPYHNYYFRADGSLFKVDVLNKPYYVYPHSSVSYNKYGNFKNATFVVSKHEQYLYDAEKKLMGHWVDDACYDERGNVLMLRTTAF